jgi:hypothetical protein
MSVISTSNVTGLLAQVYDRQSYSINFERTYSPFWSRVKSFNKGGAPLGISRRWSVRTFDAWNVQGIAEGGDFPAINQSQNIQPYVNAVSIAGATGWTEQALLQITGEGSLGATSILSDSVDELTRNYFQLLNKYCMGHGTGRLAVVQDTTDTLTTSSARGSSSASATPSSPSPSSWRFRSSPWSTAQGARRRSTATTDPHSTPYGPRPSIVA